MDEARFRALMHGAIGDEAMGQWLPGAVRKRVAQPAEPASRARVLAIVAAFALFAVLALALVPRILHRGQSPASGVATPSRVQPLKCRLPVIVYDQKPGPDPTDPLNGGTEVMKLWGFVDTSTGAFTRDPKASPTKGMPVAPVYTDVTPARTGAAPPVPALSYSPGARRWFPVAPEWVSPDGLSYAYLGDIYGKDLMRYDIATRQSIDLWHSAEQIDIVRWTARGILVDSAVSTGHWLVDPATGAVTPAPPPISPLPPPYPKKSFGSAGTIGTTTAGEPIGQAEVLNGQTVTIWVYIDTAAHKRITIYHRTGPVGNLVTVDGITWHMGSGFEAGRLFATAGGIWFGTLAPTTSMWHWDPTRGLTRVDIHLVDKNLLRIVPAGPCF